MPDDHHAQPPTLLCLAAYEKGRKFLEQAVAQGCRVVLITGESLRDSEEWPREGLHDIFYMPDPDWEWNREHLLLAVAHLNRQLRIDRIIGLDDFDQEKAAMLREHLRLPGLGESDTRYFRDKLAMRTRAAECAIPVPAFIGTCHYADITDFVDGIPAPWILKPRTMAGAIGITKLATRELAWEAIHKLGEKQSFYVLEQFVPGDIFHVDSVWWNGQMVGAFASAYGTPPFEVAHEGGIFTTRLLPRHEPLATQLCDLNRRVLKAFHLKDGVSHSEFIREEETGELLFLETSCRVGGAYIADLVEAGAGVNLWREWAKIEAALAAGDDYEIPKELGQCAGLLVSLARDEWPNTYSFNDPEVVLRIAKRHHVGLLVRSPDCNRIVELLNQYSERVRKEFHASQPPPDRPRA